ncbi:hypothetical protein [Kitasatospora sp. NPDC001683]
MPWGAHRPGRRSRTRQRPGRAGPDRIDLLLYFLTLGPNWLDGEQLAVRHGREHLLDVGRIHSAFVADARERGEACGPLDLLPAPALPVALPDSGRGTAPSAGLQSGCASPWRGSAEFEDGWFVDSGHVCLNE